MRILGVSGSPIAGGNTDEALRMSLEVASGLEGVETEMISLAGKTISGCTHCNWCLRNQTEERPCVQEDDMQAIYPKILRSDGLVLATPVYIGRLSGYLASFLDRLRVFVHGNLYRGALTDKVGAAMAVGWFRNTGLETTLQSIVVGFLVFRMIPVGSLGCPWGAPLVATEGGAGRFSPDVRHGVLRDEYGLRASRSMMERVVSLARRLKGSS